MDLNRLSDVKPLLHPDGAKGGNSSKWPVRSNADIKLERSFKGKVISNIESFFKSVFLKAGLSAKFEILEDKSLEIRPKRSKKPWFEKQQIPSGYVTASVAALNTHYDGKFLGRLSADYNSDYGSYRIYFDSHADSREMNAYLLSSEDLNSTEAILKDLN